MVRDRRLVFGEDAESYDRSRPSYPDPLIADLVGLAGLGDGGRALEIGAGTGKATAMFAARGVPVLAIEPSAEMAAVARRNCAQYPAVEIVETDFERWRPAGQEFALVYAAQSWHWIAPEVRLRRARAALSAGGLLAVFWNRPRWDRSELRKELITVYRGYGPELELDGPMHPVTNLPVDEYQDWGAEIDAGAGLEGADVRRYEWTQTYSAAGYAELIGTLSEILLMDAGLRRQLLGDIRAAIDAAGGTLTMSYITLLYLARTV
jgi:SAM-dependent methyltransferase